MTILRRRLLVGVLFAALGVAAMSVPFIRSASAGGMYESLSYGSCSGYGTGWTYSTYTATDTTGTVGCWHWVQLHWYSDDLGYYITESPVESWSYRAQDSIGIATYAYNYHLLGPDEYQNDGATTYSGP